MSQELEARITRLEEFFEDKTSENGNRTVFSLPLRASGNLAQFEALKGEKIVKVFIVTEAD